MMRDGKGNLNWPLVVVLFRFALRKQTNDTVNTKKKEKTITLFFDMGEKTKRG